MPVPRRPLATITGTSAADADRDHVAFLEFDQLGEAMTGSASTERTGKVTVITARARPFCHAGSGAGAKHLAGQRGV